MLACALVFVQYPYGKIQEIVLVLIQSTIPCKFSHRYKTVLYALINKIQAINNDV